LTWLCDATRQAHRGVTGEIDAQCPHQQIGRGRQRDDRLQQPGGRLRRKRAGPSRVIGARGWHRGFENDRRHLIAGIQRLGDTRRLAAIACSFDVASSGAEQIIAGLRARAALGWAQTEMVAHDFVREKCRRPNSTVERE
jgi:hypothetical protein